MKISNYEFDPEQIRRDAPLAEPERQFYFMEMARAMLKAQFEERSATGETLERYGSERLQDMLTQSFYGTFTVKTFGCQMNARDSEKLIGILEQIGYQEVDSEEADFVLYNTCTVRENANLRVYGRLGQLGAYKKKNPDMMIALCGCMMQEKEVVEKIKRSYRQVDLIFGTHNIFKLAELVYTCLEERRQEEADREEEKGRKRRMVIDVWEDTQQIVEDLPVERKYSFKSGVNIMFGCNNFCSYCIVPYVRGRERSRKPEEILKEIRNLASDGVVEIMLLGQNVNSYGTNLDEPMTFAQLLEEVEKIEGIERIRFMTSHPKDLSQELIDVMAKSKKICRHLHLPLQSGSTKVLKAMNRHYTKEDFLKLAAEIKASVPGISLTTDLIVGFPGETEEDFEETMDVVRKVGFDSAFTFIYSKRTGTPAAVMENQISEEEVKHRFDRLLKEVQEISAKLCGRDVHTVQQVLVEEVNDHSPELMTGRLSNNTIVHFPGASSMIGRLINVYLEESKGFYYMGTIAEPAE